MPPHTARNPRRSSGKGLVAPRRTPEELADLVSCLTSQEKAELTYELVYYAALAAVENDVTALSAVLAELEDMAEVAADPQRRQELEKAIEEAAAPNSGKGHPPVDAE